MTRLEYFLFFLLFIYYFLNKRTFNFINGTKTKLMNATFTKREYF